MCKYIYNYNDINVLYIFLKFKIFIFIQSKLIMIGKFNYKTVLKYVIIHI